MLWRQRRKGIIWINVRRLKNENPKLVTGVDSQTNSESKEEVVPSSWADRNENEAKKEGEIRNGDASMEGVMNAYPSQLDKLDGSVEASMHDGKYDEAISQTNHVDKDHNR
ncbi:hypothetical protein K7X08_002757 [Anisodus acutangulus]|uniref:Uncharacterized protein n=1 Tax=Anisodus acutangulus TaxID=402998 RepID=A0A9Q1MHH1_9SOLA|nr:hypothetical protein K7X08_002757 [Anisodus acutangulus]